jgi:hypothetical protein
MDADLSPHTHCTALHDKHTCLPTLRVIVSFAPTHVIFLRLGPSCLPSRRFSCSFAYYGLSLGASNLSENLYFNVVLLGAVEMPAYLLAGLTIKRVGARTLCVTSLLAAGACCILSSVYACQGPAEHATDTSGAAIPRA